MKYAQKMILLPADSSDQPTTEIGKEMHKICMNKSLNETDQIKLYQSVLDKYQPKKEKPVKIKPVKVKPVKMLKAKKTHVSPIFDMPARKDKHADKLVPFITMPRPRLVNRRVARGTNEHVYPYIRPTLTAAVPPKSASIAIGTDDMVHNNDTHMVEEQYVYTGNNGPNRHEAQTKDSDSEDDTVQMVTPSSSVARLNSAWTQYREARK
jgi:hypothetical protein